MVGALDVLMKFLVYIAHYLCYYLLMLLKPAPISTRQLTWDPQSRQYVGEISSTHGFGRVFDDSIDEGFTLVSAKTGNEIVFAVEEENRDSENDITDWVLKPVTPGAPAITVLLFND